MQDLLADRTRRARLFWAAGLDAPATDFAQAECDRLAPALDSPKIRWQPRDNWHLTLGFLGNLAVGDALAMGERLAAPAATLAPFSVVLGAAQWFPSVVHPLVIALPVAATPPLLALASAVAEAARDAGHPLEARPFRGHVTLARMKHGYRPRDPLPDVAASGTLRIDHLALYESIGGEAGVRYVPILKLPLRAAAR